MNKNRAEAIQIIDQHKIGAKSVVDANALVAKYEVLLKERAPDGLTIERANLLFQVLHSVLPHFGIFKPLISMVTQELYDLIFSSEHLTAEKGLMGRTPYFCILEKAAKEDNLQKAQLNHERELLQESLFKKNALFEEAMETLAARNTEIDQLKTALAEYKTLAYERKAKVEELTEELTSMRASSDEYGGQLKRQIKRLESGLLERNMEVEYLQEYKDGYTEMNEAFRENPLLGDLSAPKIRKSVEASKKEELIGDIQVAVKMEEDLLNITNTIIDHFDEFMETHKQDLVSKDFSHSDDPMVVRTMERDLEQADQELWNTQETFRKNMNDIDSELGLVRKHMVMLEEKLDRNLQEEKEKKLSKLRSKRLEAERKKEAAEGTTTASVSTMLTEAEDKVGLNQFIPRERVFSKYAIQLYYSQDGGATFFLHQKCQFCEGCDDKTIACPHKVMKESVFSMPHKVTHLRLTRPPVRLSRDFLELKKRLSKKETQAPPTASTVIRMASGMIGHSGRQRQATHSTVSGGFLTSPMTGSTAAMSVLMKYPLVKVWDDFKTRAPEMRQIYRNLSKERVESLLEQFLAYVMWNDDHGEHGRYLSIMDTLFSFFAERYITEEARNYAAQDFISGLLLHEQENKMISLFAHVLVGNLDLSVNRYLLLVTELISMVQWRHLDDFKIFLSVLHPLLHDDDLESLQMGYTSYADNKISAHRVFDYILFMIFKGREPLFLEMEQQLAQYPVRSTGVMTEDEFADVLDQVLQVGDEKMRRRMFGEAEAAINTDPYVETQIPMERLAHMLAYMHATESFSRMKDSLVRDIERHHTKVQDSLKDELLEPPLISLSVVERLGFNIFRRNSMRKNKFSS